MTAHAAKPPSASWRQRWSWRLLVIEAAVMLSIAALCLRLLPFRHVVRLLIGRPAIGGAPAEAAGPVSGAIWRVSRAVGRAAALLPFPVLCLPQAIAAKALLGRRGYGASLHLSARLGGDTEPAAHAWLIWEGRPVIGGGMPAGQAEIARFR